MDNRAPIRVAFALAFLMLVVTSCSATITPMTPEGAQSQPSPTAAPTSRPSPSAPSTTAPSPTAVPTAAPLATAPAPTSAPTPTALTLPAALTGHSIKTVFIILMENHNWSSIEGNTTRAPYINSLISGSNNAQTSYATQYYNPPGNHPSLPNYLWLEGGQCFSYCGTDNSPKRSPNGIGSTQHLVTLLQNAGISWKAYEEGVSNGSCPVTGSGSYAPRHDPFVYFNDVTGNASYCAAHIRSYADLADDLSNNAVARYNFITPNLCDDMHDSCSPTNDAIKQGDTWLSKQVPTILGSPAYKDGGVLFITWDEAASGDGPIGMIVVSPNAKGHGYTSSTRYTHGSTLRTLQEIFGVSPMLGDAANANDLGDLFAEFP